MLGRGALGEALYRWRHVRKLSCRGDLFIMRARGCPDSLRRRASQDYSLGMPLGFPVELPPMRLAAVVHAFYPELAGELLEALEHVPGNLDVYISTPEDSKKKLLEREFAGYAKGKVEVRIFPNCGRDIAPAFVGFRDIYGNYDACVHLHTKKSPHAADELFGWRRYLYHNLLGSPDIVCGILHMLTTARVGIVFPQYIAPLRKYISWGQNYVCAKQFLERLGIMIDNRHLLEFPAGSMFWFRPGAVRPLLESGLSFADFPAEKGQVDGTLAHAVERSFLYMAESEGFSWAKVSSASMKPGKAPVLLSGTEEELLENLGRAWSSVMQTREGEVIPWKPS